MANRMDQAMAAAAEYERMVQMGDTARAEQSARDIDGLVGRWIDGANGRVWGWPSCVVARARGQARLDVTGYSPASERRWA